MQASLKLHLYKQKTYTDGTHPVLLQYIIEGRVKRKVLTRCKLEDWDIKNNKVKTKVQNSARINNFLTTEFAKAEKELYDVKNGDKSLSELFSDKKGITLQSAFDEELLRLEKEFKSGYYDKMLALQKQIKDRSILIADIDERWFGRMIQHLTEIGNSGNTIKKKIKLMRGMILRYSHKGVTKEIKAVSVPTQKAIKQKLNAQELLSLETIQLPEDDLIAAARDLFLLQIYLRGIRVGDLLQAYGSDFENGRFSYTADKTAKSMGLKIIPKAQTIVDRYKGRYNRLFPFFNWAPSKGATKFENERARLKHKETCTTVINKFLKVLAQMTGINKPLSSHIARHTFARMAIDKINNPMITMELLGHSSLAVHQSYLNDIRKDDELDQAADDIFS